MTTDTSPPLRVPSAAAVQHGEVVAVTNQKGGAGKTTTSVSLAAVLAEEGARVLLIDADPQKGSATKWLPPQFGPLPEDPYDLSHVLLGEATLDEATWPTTVPGVSIAPSYKSLTQYERHDEILGKDLLLRKALRKSAGNFDVVLVDCAPSLAQLAVTSLVAASAVIIPLKPGGLDMAGVSDLNDTLALVREDLRPDQRTVAIVLTQFLASGLSEDTLESLTAEYPDACTARVRHTVRVGEAQIVDEPLTVYAPQSTATEDYRILARGLFAPVLDHVRQHRG